MAAASTHETRNDTKSNAKQVSIETLQARLSDGIDLALDIKQAHWNLKGPSFIGIHLMLDGFRDEMDDFNDKMAGRTSRTFPVGAATARTVKPMAGSMRRVAPFLLGGSASPRGPPTIGRRSA